jgi:hypothetical protein
MALGSTQPLKEISSKNLPGGTSGRRVGLTTLPTSIIRMSEKWGVQPLPNLRASTACVGTFFSESGVSLHFVILVKVRTIAISYR